MEYLPDIDKWIQKKKVLERVASIARSRGNKRHITHKRYRSHRKYRTHTRRR
uniref:Uncharacterized protein n=1 Tax=viral metagenome TaxID=1070528 RepID=A0A6C0AMR2_9ZZZZ